MEKTRRHYLILFELVELMSCNNNGNQDPLKVLGRSRGYSKKELLNFLPHHNKFTPNLIKKVEELSEVVLRNLGTPLARKVVKMVKEISLYFHPLLFF